MKLNGTTYSDETPKRVVEILEHSRETKERIIILYGDTVTGRLWKKEVDERGYVGRHNGVPVLVKNVLDNSGSTILDSNILEIRTSKGSVVLYRRGFNEKSKS